MTENPVSAPKSVSLLIECTTVWFLSHFILMESFR